MKYKYYYQITKYDAVNYSKNGGYEVDEWTTVYDVGKTYNNKVFTMEEYLKIENSYLKCISYLMKDQERFLISDIYKFRSELEIRDILPFEKQEIILFNKIEHQKDIYLNFQETITFGKSAYKNADVSLVNSFFSIAESNGFSSNYSYSNRFKHTGNRNHGLHDNHFHIGLPDSKKHSQKGVKYGEKSNIPLP